MQPGRPLPVNPQRTNAGCRGDSGASNGRDRSLDTLQGNGFTWNGELIRNQ